MAIITGLLRALCGSLFLLTLGELQIMFSANVILIPCSISWSGRLLVFPSIPLVLPFKSVPQALKRVFDHKMLYNLYGFSPSKKSLELILHVFFNNLIPKFRRSIFKNSFVEHLFLQGVFSQGKKKKYWNKSIKRIWQNKLYGPFLLIEFNCLKARATSRRQFIFTTKFQFA